jgi:uncharacterized membrane protein
MNQVGYMKWALGLTLAGTLFSGYLSGVKFFSETCALSEPCPYFLGQPACYFGFAMFTTMLVITLLGYTKITTYNITVKTNLIISLLGILFAGYYVAIELMGWIEAGKIVLYTLGLPTCAYGLIFYIAIFILSIKKRESAIQ